MIHPQLLFFDTFSHDTSIIGGGQELNLDLVQFPSPVYISEVRVIPLGAKVKANFPGGRMGATNPSRFDLELFVNNLRAPGASTFESVGLLQYNQAGCISLSSQHEVATDGLVLRGLYSTITLAVYGTVSDCSPEELARQGAAAVARQTVKEEAAELPQSAGDSGRSLGEAYAAQWTEQHSQQALKAEPPEEDTWAAVKTNGNRDREGETTNNTNSTTLRTERDNGSRYSEIIRTSPQRNRDRYSRERERDRSYDRISRDRDRSGDRSRDRDRSRDQMSRDIERTKDRERSFERSPEPRSDRFRDRRTSSKLRERSLSPRDRRSLSRGRSRTPRERSRSGSRDGERYRGGERRRIVRSPVSRDRSPYDYDKTSLNSSGSRRLASPRSSPRRRPSMSPSPRFRRERSTSVSGSRRSRSPRRRSPSAVSKNHRTPERNGFKSPTPTKENIISPVNEDILDAVSDISEGDIPDDIEPDEPDTNDDRDLVEDDSVTNRSSIAKEDVEEISDEEAEWSDDFDAGCYSDMETVELGEDWEDPVVYFDPVDVDLVPLTILSDPTETLYDRVTSNKIFSLRTEKTLELIVTNLDNPIFDEKFIENIEHLTKTVQLELPGVPSQILTDRLVEIGLSSIDFDSAMSQQKPPSKLRHIKSGLKLVVELLECRGQLCNKLLSSEVQVKLLSLYSRDHMAMSLKLLILKALDVSLNTLEGIHHFTQQNLYNKLLEVSISSQSSRTQFSLSSILTKLHLSEQLEHLSSVISCEETEVSSPAVSDILDNLRELYADLTLRMSHPARFLPSQLHFDLSEKEFGCPKSSYFSLVSAYGLLELLTCLLTNPVTSEQEDLMVRVQELLTIWMKDEEGLLFLANNPENTNVIVRTLIGYRQDVTTDEKQTEEERKDINEDQEGPTSSSVLGCELGHHVMAVQYIDIITRDVTSANSVRLDMETTEVHNAISSLYGMTFTPKGREAVVAVVTMGSHLSPLLALTKHSTEDSKKDMKKSAIRGFASELILLTVRSSDNVPFLKRFATQLLTTANSDSHSKLAELQAWCGPLSDPCVFTEAGIGHLIGLARRKVEESEEQRDQTSAELVTIVRLLRHLAGPRTIARTSGEEEMKYKYAAISMFSSDLVPLYTQLLDKISRDHEQPHLHTATFIGQRGFTILSILQPVVSTLLIMLEMVISCRDTEFKDLSVVAPLLRTFTLLSIIPSSSSYHQGAKTTISDLVQCLLTFTKPNVDLTTNNVSRSLWTLMLAELVTYTRSMPCLLVPGLSLLSQLLPLPLPLPSSRALTRQEVEVVSTSRKLWSAHLHPLSTQLSLVISQAASCSYTPLLSLTQKVVEQLSSLSPPTALLVVTAVVQGIKEVTGPPLDRMFQFLAWCVTQPPIKTVMLDKMWHDLAFRAAVLSQLDSGLAGTDKCPESCVLVVRSLCDPSVSLSTSESQDVMLADSLPNKETLVSLVNCLLDHLGSESRNLVSQTSSLNVLMKLTDHDHTSSILKHCLVSSPPEKEKSLFCFLRKLAVEFSATDPGIEKLVSALLSSVSQLTALLSLTELARGLGWSSAEDGVLEAAERRRTHPLVVLSNRIREAERDQSDLQLTNIGVKCSELVSLLETVPADAVLPADLLTSSLPEARSPLELWSGRDLAVTCGEISSDQLSTVYWLTSETEDRQESSPAAMATVDLMAVSQKYLSSLDLVSAAKEVTKERTLATDRKKKGVKKSLMETKVLQNKNIISAFKDGKNVTLRGRGFARTAFKTDPFRTRPPNTSRPPSLHVDDFLVLEMKGQQPTGPTGYNKQSVKAAKELFALREAEAALKPPPVMREATREPVGLSRGRGRAERGTDRGGRSFRGGGAGNSRNFRKAVNNQ